MLNLIPRSVGTEAVLEYLERRGNPIPEDRI